MNKYPDIASDIRDALGDPEAVESFEWPSIIKTAALKLRRSHPEIRLNGNASQVADEIACIAEERGANDPVGLAALAQDCLTLDDEAAAIAECLPVEDLTENKTQNDSDNLGADEEDCNDGNKKKESPSDPEKKSASRCILEEASKYILDLFHTDEHKGFAIIQTGDHQEVLAIRTRAFRLWLGRLFYCATGGAPHHQALADALAILEGKALFDGQVREVNLRTASRDRFIHIDLGDPGWQVVRISPDGWTVTDGSDGVLFRRARGQLALPIPITGGRIDKLRSLVNISSDDDWRLLLAWLTYAIRPIGPYPVLALHGEQGAAKSTTARVLKSIIDPSKAPLRSEPRDVRDLMICASSSHLIVLDNLSSMPQWLSDCLCRLATGGGFGTRELYSDDDEVLFSSTRPILLTGIEEVASSGDLLDRSILLNLPTIPEDGRLEEAVFWQRFEGDRPQLFGALLDAVAGTLSELPKVRLLALPRMADFSRWGEALGRFLGWGEGAFLDSYRRNIGEANEVAVESSPAGTAFRRLLDETGSWDGTATALLERLVQTVSEKVLEGRNWPKSAKGLSGILRRLAPAFRRLGYEISFERETETKKRERVVRAKVGKRSSESSGPSDCQGKSPDGRTSTPGNDRPQSSATVRNSPYEPDGPDGPDGDDPASAHGEEVEWRA
ncbi:MAG: hypothetical protein HY717_11195 [Planctomycetes bacterium]|nr:hypothetical protein [Planctomycetota bacterium]